MKTLIAVTVSSQYINNESGEVVELTHHQKLMSAIFTTEYTFQEIFTINATFKAKTTKELNSLVTAYEANGIYPSYYIRTDLLNKKS